MFAANKLLEKLVLLAENKENRIDSAHISAINPVSRFAERLAVRREDWKNVAHSASQRQYMQVMPLIKGTC